VRIEVYVENFEVSPSLSIPVQETCRDLSKLSDSLLAEPVEYSTQCALYREVFPPESAEQRKIPPKPGHLAYPVETGDHPKQKGRHDPPHRVDSRGIAEIETFQRRLSTNPPQKLSEWNQASEACEILGREVEEKPPDLIAKTMAYIYAQGVPPVKV
jgi:hypothetical protein